jgi:ABC-2 type transport system permease protein
MSGIRQGWLVAHREVRERSRSGAFRASIVVMVLVVAAVIILPSVLGGGGTRDVGLVGKIPTELPSAIRSQSNAVHAKTRIHQYRTPAAGEQAVRHGDIDVLVVDARKLEWQRRADEQLRAVVTGAIQVVAMRDRAAAAGIKPEQLLPIIAPVPVESVELGRVAGRSADDETAALVMNVLLLMVIATFGGLVLTGVVEEKASRVVEVLLARIPARTLLAGKVAGIGLLGLAQVAVTAFAALVATTTVDSFNVPAARGAVIAWVVVWFVLGYSLYAMVYGALGSLASRTEDAQSVAGPVQVVLIAGYFVSFAAIGSPDTLWARLVSFFPATAPFAMPSRIAMGATAWWEPVGAVALMLITLAGLVELGGRVYAGAILHNGPTLKLRDAWHRAGAPEPTAMQNDTRRVDTSGGDRRSVTDEGAATMTRTDRTANRVTSGTVIIVIAVVVGAAISVLAHDFIIGLAAGAAFYAVATRVVKARTGHHDRHLTHH